MAEAPRRTDGLLSRELNEPPQSQGVFEDIPNIPKVAGDYQAAYGMLLRHPQSAQSDALLVATRTRWS